jgi:hypothetical protein
MADYFQHPHGDAPRTPTRVRTHTHSDHSGPILAGLAILMLAVLALLWTGKETPSPLPQAISVSQTSGAASLPAAKPAPAPIAIHAAPPVTTPPVTTPPVTTTPVTTTPVTPPPSEAVAAAGDTRSPQP